MIKTKPQNELNETAKNQVLPPQTDEVVEGKIAEIGKNSIFVDLGPMGIGIIYGREIKGSRQLFKELKTGDKISAVVTEPENENGYVELSVKKAFREQAWQELAEAKKEEQIISVKITAANRGGLIANINGISGFLPVSQLSTENYPRVEEGDKNKILQHLNKFVNREMKVRVLDLNPGEEKLIVSEKATEEKKLKETLARYKVGDVVEGEISGVVDFGAFIKFSPAKESPDDATETLEGLIHISELDWQLIENPRDIIKVGDRVEAKIIGIDNNRLSLSLKALKEDPWKNAAKKYKKGQKIKGEVTKLNPFGAFVKVDKNIQGLAHISEFDNDPKKIQEMMEVGQKYEFEIASIEPNEHKMALSLSAAKKKAVKKISKETAE